MSETTLVLRPFPGGMLGNRHHPASGWVEHEGWYPEECHDVGDDCGLIGWEWGVIPASSWQIILSQGWSTWSILRVARDDVAFDHGRWTGKCRCRAGEVIYTGDRQGAGKTLMAAGPPTDRSPFGIVPFATVTATDDRPVIAGDFGTASVGSGWAAAGMGGMLEFRDAGRCYRVRFPFERKFSRPSLGGWAAMYPAAAAPAKPEWADGWWWLSSDYQLEPNTFYELAGGVRIVPCGPARYCHDTAPLPVDTSPDPSR